MGQLAPQRRPHYPPAERLAILELKAVRGWSLRQTAAAFQLTAATVASWLTRLAEEGPQALVQLPQAVNRFPDYVAHLVQCLRTVCPLLGKRKIAAILARAGLHLGTTSVARMLTRKRGPFPPLRDSCRQATTPRVVTAKYPGHLWHIDLTTVSTLAGFATAWFPCTLPQQWPFCWWVALVVDHYSRRLMGFAIYRNQPTSEQVRAFLGQTIHTAAVTPKHLVCDKGPQFWCHGFRRWCRRKGIRPRFGAIGQHGSIAVVERLVLSVKRLLASPLFVPLRDRAMRRELALVGQWYNEHRPHTTLGGRTPNEVYFGRYPDHRKPRFEPRHRWPRDSPCAKPWALVRGRPGATVAMELRFLAGRRRLPIVTLTRAA